MERRPDAPETDEIRRPPLVAYVRSMDGDFLLPREVAELLGVTKGTLVDMARRSPTPLGPTHQGQYGATVVHLYTPARVAQLTAFMAQEKTAGRDRGIRGPIRMWTKSETYIRDRAFDRARRYRNRAKVYREAGKTAQATDLETRATKLVAELDKSRRARARKVAAAHRK